MAIRVPDQPVESVQVEDVHYPIQVVHDGWRMSADTVEEILGLFIDGYADQPDGPGRLLARLRVALQARVMVQTLLNAGEPFDRSSDGERQTLCDQSDEPLAVAEWECPVPLVLITLCYQPAGERPQPSFMDPGQVWWIDPSTPRALLETLHQVRWLDLKRIDPPTASPEDRAYRNLGTNGAAGYWWREVPS